MIKILSLHILLLGAFVWASESLLLAQYTQKKDASHMVTIVQKVLTGQGYVVEVKIVKKSNLYEVIVEEIENKPTKERIVALLQDYFRVEKERSDASFGGLISLRTGLDSNLYSHTDIDKTEFGSLILDNNTSQVSDLFHREYASLFYGRQTGDKRVRWNTKISLYNKDHLSHDDTDMTQVKAKADVAYALSWGEIGLAAVQTKLWYGGIPLLDSYRLDVPLRYRVDKKKNVSVRISAIKKRFVPQIHKDMNSDRLELGATFSFATDWAYAQRVDWLYARERKLGGTLTHISYDTYSVSWAILKHLYPQNDLAFRLNLEYRAYTDKIFGLSKREDMRWRVDAKWIHHLSEHNAIVFAYGGVLNDSNVDTYAFKSHTLEIGFLKTF